MLMNKLIFYTRNYSVCRHCIQTVSPPGSALPPGIELPHVAAPSGSHGVPAGEACYSCNVDAEGIPLSKPGKPTYLRVKRSAGATMHEVCTSEVLLYQPVLRHLSCLIQPGPVSSCFPFSAVVAFDIFPLSSICCISFVFFHRSIPSRWY